MATPAVLKGHSQLCILEFLLANLGTIGGSRDGTWLTTCKTKGLPAVLCLQLRDTRFSDRSPSLWFRSEAKKTKVKKETNNPQFDEVFYFEVGMSCARQVTLKVPREALRLLRLLGSILFSVSWSSSVLH